LGSFLPICIPSGHSYLIIIDNINIRWLIVEPGATAHKAAYIKSTGIIGSDGLPNDIVFP
jgi:hypothetical protein